MLNKKLMVWLGSIGLVLSGSAFADAIAIANNSFETPVIATESGFVAAPISGWVNEGAGSPLIGVYKPPSSQFTGAGGGGTPVGADGVNVGYLGVSAGNGNSAILTQTLTGVTVQEGSYTLTAALGKGTGFTPASHNYLVLMAGTAWVTWMDVLPAEFTQSEFVDKSLTYVVTSDNAYIGSTLGIKLYSANATSTAKITCWDNIRLDFTAVPEPCTMMLLGIGGLYMLRKKRM